MERLSVQSHNRQSMPEYTHPEIYQESQTNLAVLAGWAERGPQAAGGPEAGAVTDGEGGVRESFTCIFTFTTPATGWRHV